MDVLVVDDSPIIRRVLQLVVQSFGNCEVVQNGQQALDSVGLRLAEAKPYDIICLDLCLPDLGGLDVLREIRNLEAKCGEQVRARIIIISASDELETIRATRQNGADAYLMKPIDKQQLVNAFTALGFRPGA